MSVSKKLRFEVFKRDKFTCQYCGRKSPDVILECDHVQPKSKGGEDVLLNLTTSCFDCNHGKGARTLNDDSVVVKQRGQLEELQERQEQIAMMVDWHTGLMGIEGETLDHAEGFWCSLSGWDGITNEARMELKKLIRKFGFNEVLTAMENASESYFRYEDGIDAPTSKSANKGFNKIGSICFVEQQAIENPLIKQVFYLRAVLRNRIGSGYISLWQAKELIESAFSWGANRDQIYGVVSQASSWTNFKNRIYDLIDDVKGGE